MVPSDLKISQVPILKDLTPIQVNMILLMCLSIEVNHLIGFN
jgi:hypothetical protein